jgi:hypothetical protein
MQIIEQLFTDNFFKEIAKSKTSKKIKQSWADFANEYQAKKNTAYVHTFEDLQNLSTETAKNIRYIQLILPNSFSEKEINLLLQCVNLQALDLINYNSTQELAIPLHHFKDLKIVQLHKISLKTTKLEALQQLLRITITGTNLKNYLDNIGTLTDLQYIDCSSNGLQTLPESIEKLVNLQYLDCSNNKLTELPENISNLSNLQKLYCSNNQLQHLPSMLGNLKNLVFLYCVNNQLQVLSDTIGNLSNLQGLYCGSNKLQSLPSSIANLHKLVYLDCSNNSFQKIPISFADVPEKLQHWDLEDNPFGEMPELRNMDARQIMKFLDENRGEKPHTTIWKMDKLLQNVLHKYLIGFKNFVWQIEGREIVWEIAEHQEGLQITVSAKNLTIKQIDNLLHLFVGNNLEVDMLTLQRKLSIQEMFELKSFFKDLAWEQEMLQKELDYVLGKVTFLQDSRPKLVVEINFFQDKTCKKIEIIQNLQRQLEVKSAEILSTNLQAMRQGLVKIRIFLCSPIELREEREALLEFFALEAKKTIRHGISLEVVEWEFGDELLTDTTEIDALEIDLQSKLKVCKVFLALFYTKIDKNYRKQFKMAYENFQNRQQLATFYTYFKELTPVVRKKTSDTDLLSLFKFKDKLATDGKKIAQYFSNIDNLKYQLKNLLEMEILPK